MPDGFLSPGWKGPMLASLIMALSACQDGTQPEAVRVELHPFGPATWEAQIGTVVPDSPAVLVMYPDSVPAQGLELAWAVTVGGGQVQPVTSTTSADGVARVRWTLGDAVGEQRLEAYAIGAAETDTVVFEALATPPPPDDWSAVIDVDLTAAPTEIESGGDSLTLRLAFTNSWEGTLRLKTSDSCLGVPVVYDADGQTAASLTTGCLYWVVTHSIPPGEVLEWEHTWGGVQLAPGEYTVRAHLHVTEVNDDPVELVDPEAALTAR